MIELLEKANEQTLRRSTSSESLTSSNSSQFSPSNQYPKIAATARQHYTGAQGPDQRIAQMKASSGSTSSSSSTLVTAVLRKDRQRFKVPPPLIRTSIRSFQVKDRLNQRPIAKPNVRYGYVKPDRISRHPVVRAPFSQGTARVGRAAIQSFPKGRPSFQTTTKLGGASVLGVVKPGGVYSQTEAKDGGTFSELTAKRLMRSDKIVTVAKQNTEEPHDVTHQSDSSETSSTSSFRKVMSFFVYQLQSLNNKLIWFTAVFDRRQFKKIYLCNHSCMAYSSHFACTFFLSNSLLHDILALSISL